MNNHLRQRERRMHPHGQLAIVNEARDGRQRLLQRLLVRELETRLDDGAEHLTRDPAHVRLGRGKLGEDVLQEELLHVPLDVWVTHHEGPEGGGHVQCAVALRRGGLTMRFRIPVSEIGL